MTRKPTPKTVCVLKFLRHFDYFVTESSHHMSEYTPWFRRTAADRARFIPEHLKRWAEENTTQGNASSLQNLDEEAKIRQSFMYARHERREDYFANQRRDLEKSEPLPFNRTHEYCSFIVHAIETNTPYRFNGNVPNTDLISNLPPGCNVEVPILVDSAGIHPCSIGNLPAQCAGINRTQRECAGTHCTGNPWSRTAGSCKMQLPWTHLRPHNAHWKTCAL